MDVFVARQPIFNKNEDIVAYELLYRSNQQNRFPNIDQDGATVDVFINSFMSIGLEELTGGKPAFINFTANLINSKLFDFMDSTKLVIEVLEDVEITPQVIDHIKQFKQFGFQVALDDFTMVSFAKTPAELYPYIDIIKVDFMATTALERMTLENELKIRYPHLKLLAEKVETRHHYEIAKHSGYSHFQGYFFEKPQIVAAVDIPPNVLQYLHVLSLLKQDEPDINEISENIERDLSLTYKLLQLINETKKRTRSKVRSIKQAVLLLGLTELRKWIYFLALREAKIDLKKDASKEVLYASLYRAKFCEKLAQHKFKKNASEYFLVGLFSLMDVILQRSMGLILQKLPFDDQIIQTLNGQDTELSPYLNLSIALSRGDFEQVVQLSETIQVSEEIILRIHDEATTWVRHSFSE